jgi:hypothetical protein
MMWSWRDKITRKELLEHMYLLPTLTPAELKDELKQRNQPVSGRQKDLWLRLLFYDIANMKWNEIIPPEIWEKFKSQIPGWPEQMSNLYYELQAVLEAGLEQRFVLNWTSFPEVLLDE